MGSAAEQMSWDTTTKEKALFEMAFDKENLSGGEPLLDESGEFHDSGMPHTMAGPLNLEEEVNSPVNDDGDLPVSEPPQVEELDLVTEESRDIVREPLRLPQRRLTSKQPPPSAEQWTE